VYVENCHRGEQTPGVRRLLRSVLSVPSFCFFSFESRSLSVDGCRRTCAAVPESPWRNRLWVYGPRAKPASNCKTYMTHTVEAVRLLGFVPMVIGSWFHEVWLLPTGIVIIVLGWLRGVSSGREEEGSLRTSAFKSGSASTSSTRSRRCAVVGFGISSPRCCHCEIFGRSFELRRRSAGYEFQQ